MAASRKLAKYDSGTYLVQPIALETQGSIHELAAEFLNNGHRIALVSSDDKQGQCKI